MIEVPQDTWKKGKIKFYSTRPFEWINLIYGLGRAVNDDPSEPDTQAEKAYMMLVIAAVLSVFGLCLFISYVFLRCRKRWNRNSEVYIEEGPSVERIQNYSVLTPYVVPIEYCAQTCPYEIRECPIWLQVFEENETVYSLKR